MTRAYYTLCVYDTEQGCWFDEFGDYSLNAVGEEHREHSAPSRHKRIIATNGTAADMIAKRDALPKPKR